MGHPIINNLLLFLSGSFRLIKLLFGIIAGIIIFSTASFLGIYFFFARDLPDIRGLEDYHPPMLSAVYADDGTQIGEFWTECRIFLPYNEIPKRVAQAFIDSEDERFFEHKGVDVRSIFRAFLTNLRAGSVKQGGSTITQQITRSLLLTREKSFERKAKEAILATRLERYLNKEQILTLYLNQIYLGNRAYGVAAAARNYFHKPPNELSLGQIALIAGLPTAPTNFSPINNAREARIRQIHVLSRMREMDHITREEMQEALGETFTIYVAGIDKDFNDKDSAWFIEHVRRLVKEKYGDDVLYHQGLKIYTTVNLPIQRAANMTIRKNIEGLDRRTGYRGPLEHINPSAITDWSKQADQQILAKLKGNEIEWPPEIAGKHPPIPLKLDTGEVYEAVVTDFSGKDVNIQIGSFAGTVKYDGVKWARRFVPASMGAENVAYVNDPKTILKAGDIILVRRLEDSSFQLAQDPLIQSALVAIDTHTGFIKAMVGGYDFAKSEFNRATQALRQPGSSFKPFVYSAALDKGYTEDTVVVDGPVNFQVGRNAFWSPKNYGGNYNGALSFKSCITMSRNIPTAKIVFDIGTHYLTAYERKMGVSSPIDKYLSMSLGANGVYLLEMVQAYTVFPNQGVFNRAVAITKIEDSRGNVIEEISAAKAQPLPTEITPAIEGEQEKASEESAEGATSASPSKIGKSVAPDELNTTLWEEGRTWIDRDKLNLTDLELKTLYGASIPSGNAITSQTAYLMVDMLKNVVQNGTGTRVKLLGKPAAGKTGTTNDETDVWFIGFVPDLAAGVWIGYDEVQKIGRGVTGGVYAAPIFVDFMKIATDGWEAKDFPKPEDFPSGPIGSLAGGSSLFGSAPKTTLPGMMEGGGGGIGGGGNDRAGRFFEEDFESF